MLPLLITILKSEFSLATASSRDQGWFYSIYTTVRHDVIGAATGSVQLALGVAALLIVFKMIKISYDIMSDEQTGGFGGIRLWTILRPIVIFFLIQNCSLLVGALDSLTNTVTRSIQSIVDKQADEKAIYTLVSLCENTEVAAEAAGVEQALAETSEWYEAWHDSRLSAPSMIPGTTGYQMGAGPQRAQQALADYQANSGNTLGQGPTSAADPHDMPKRFQKEALRDYFSALAEANGVNVRGKAMRKTINRFVNMYAKTSDDGDGDAKTFTIDIHDGNLIPAICYWLYDNLYMVIQCVAEIMLMILAMFAPWILVLSLLEPWKQAIWSFITAYIQISFWKVTAAIINFATVRCRTVAITCCLPKLLSDVKTAATTDTVPPGACNAALILSAVASIAGVFCILKVQDITAAIIPSASSLGSASGGGGTAKSASGGFGIGVAGKAAGAIAGGVKAVAGMGGSSQRQQQKQADRIGESVAKHMESSSSGSKNKN